MQISFNLSDDLLGKIDDASTKESLSRSRFIVKCINEYLTSGENYDKKQQLQSEITEATVNESKMIVAGDSDKRSLGEYEHLKTNNSGKEPLINGFFSLKEVMSAKDQMISDKEIIINELKIQNEFLRGEYKKLSDRLNRLPPP
jgi:predicted transcriptional regulator